MSDNLKPWKPGESGNPNGRPKGSRNKLGESFLKDLCAHWEDNGVAALDAALEKDPAAYVRVVASLLPKHVTINDERDLDELTDAELRERISAALDRVAALERDNRGTGQSTDEPERVH